MAEDDEAAQAARDAGVEHKPRPPRLTEFDPTVRALAAVYDMLGQILRAQLAAGGAKPGKFAPYPRPETAYSRPARRPMDWARHKALVSRLLPGKTGPQ